MNVNKRLFGSDIPNKIKKKLEARQLTVSETIDPTSPISSSYQDSRTAAYTPSELLNQNFNGAGELSSRTPFIRMWTAVTLVDVPVGEDAEFHVLKNEEDWKLFI